MKGKKEKSQQKEPIKRISTTGIFILLCFGIAFLTIGFSLLNKQQPKPNHIIVSHKLHPSPSPVPLPTINPLLQGTFKTYTNALYQFSIAYPYLGENKNGNLIQCGSNIQQATFVTHDTNNNALVLPQITIDSFYTITIYPWGGELQDYINHLESNAQESTPYVYTLMPHVDESVLFQKPSSPSAYFANTFALYKKGNLIFKLDTTVGSGCQMLFDPREYNQNVVKSMTSLASSLLFSQYRNWNMATSISFLGSLIKTPTE